MPLPVGSRGDCYDVATLPARRYAPRRSCWLRCNRDVQMCRWVHLARPHIFRKEMHRIMVIHFRTEGTQGAHTYVMLKASTQPLRLNSIRYSKCVHFDTDYSPAARILSTLVMVVHRGDSSKTLGLRQSAHVLALACGGFEAFRSGCITTTIDTASEATFAGENFAACATWNSASC